MNPSSQNVRPAAAAARFYPGDPAALRDEINAFLAEVSPTEGPSPKAIIAPHAGYMYSGPIAASAYATFLPVRDQIRRVVLIGPAHFVGFRGLACCSSRAFATPLGEVPVDTDALAELSNLPQVASCDEAHAREHALEVQLPFLQVILRSFKIVPLLAGDTTPGELSQVIDALWDSPETRFVISSDLSHYHDWVTAQALDRQTATAIVALDPTRIGEDQACGRWPILGLLQSARARQLRVRTLDLRNSGDTAGPRDQVVGYGAFALDEVERAGAERPT